ncbi:MAG TPA: hypothetical protein EYP28_04460 [Methanophagales archaeon]|nr:hypothetical protein [Methanophagales archaeon]
MRRGGTILLLLCAGGALGSRLAMTGVGQEIGKTIRLVAKLVSCYSHSLNSADSMLYHYFFGNVFKTF